MDQSIAGFVSETPRRFRRDWALTVLWPALGCGGVAAALVRDDLRSDGMRCVLFTCSQNRFRSPTAEQVFSGHPGIEYESAGLNNNADNPVTPELVEWAELIFVMEKAHRSKLSAKFGRHLKKARVVCLDNPDRFDFMDLCSFAC